MFCCRIPAASVNVAVLSEEIAFRHGKKAKNRIMKSPLSEKMYDWSESSFDKLGTVNDKIINLYTKWGNGGYGIIFTGNQAVDPKFIGEAGQGIISLENHSNSSTKMLQKLATVAKSDGALIIAQVNHVGRNHIKTYTNENGEHHTITDTIEDPINFPVQKLERDVISRFGHAAKVLHTCGFDGMEIHSAHGMIFNQFLAPSNIRNDKYGGSIENRARLLVETYNHIRNNVPENTGFLVGVKLNSRDFQECGMNKEEISRLCKIIEDTEFDFVELTGGAMESSIKEANMRESTIQRENFFFDFLETCCKIFQKTVVYITGRYQTTNGMVKSVEEGFAKGVGLGRWSCAEPDFPKKILNGEINSCPNIKFAPSDFKIAKHAAHYQMKQMAKEQGSNVQITDFTNNEEAEHFKKHAQKYDEFLKSIGGPDSHADCINYNPLSQ